jgi:hypothetical protein
MLDWRQEPMCRPAAAQAMLPWCAGLDSSNAARVVDILSGLASAGVTVIITIHQPRPDVFNLMQRVLILSGDGRMVYSGTAAFIHSFLCLCAHSSIHSFTYASMHPFKQPSIHPSMHQSIHPSMASFILCLLLGSGTYDPE